MSRPTETPPRPAPDLPARDAGALVATPAGEPADDLVLDSFRAVLGSHARSGRWEAGDEIEVRAVLGEVELDFTRAELPESGVVGIEARSVLGEIHIILPDGAEVELEGTPILGSIEQRVRKKGAGERLRELVTGERGHEASSAERDADRPLFCIEASAILGVVRVSSR